MEHLSQASCYITGERTISPGFEAVAEAFDRNFARSFNEYGELGAALAVYQDGRCVVDLWGGVADQASGRAWEADTLCRVFSGTKALVATCLLILIERDQLRLNEPVATYWPEFARAGKQHVLVSQLVSHTAGLPGLREQVEIDDLLDGRHLAELLADQEPLLAPGSGIRYHGLTFGWLCGELIRRIDGRSVGEFFAEEIARPLGLEAWIGLPPELLPRVAPMELSPSWGTGAAFTNARNDPTSIAARAWLNPDAFDPDTWPWDRDEFRCAQIPAAGAIATARSIARLLGCLACQGTIDGLPLLRPKTVRDGTTCLNSGYEPVLDEPMAFGVGYQLQSERKLYGPDDDAFGHAGAGGSLHTAWPSRRISLSYIPNNMHDGPAPDPRAHALLEALDHCTSTRTDEPAATTRRDHDGYVACGR